MSNNLQISLEDIAKQLKDKGHEFDTLQDTLDLLYGIGLNTATVISIAHGGFTIPDFFKDFKPSKYINYFMPKKYINLSKEEIALEKHKRLTITNLLIILASYNQAILKSLSEIEKTIKRSMVEDPKDHIEARIAKLNPQLLSDKKALNRLQYLLPDENNNTTYEYIEQLLNIQMNILDIWLHKSDNNKLIEKIKNLTIRNYHINLLEISEEFPEVKLWIDLQFQKDMLASNENLDTTLKEIKKYQMKSFTNQFGLEEMDNLLSKNTNLHLDSLKNILDETTFENIKAHHHFIEANVREELLEETNIDELVLPKRKDIYIPQSYQCFNYKENIHKKHYLDSNNWSYGAYTYGENIGKELFHALKNPYNMNQPIIILGHPGAGKSMLSSMFSYKLINNNEFVPFLIKLRNVDSSHTDIDQHINQGIQVTVSGSPNINWVNWAKKFPDKIPVIILDGFDELLRASQTDLNDYILKIQKLQQMAQNSNLSIRVILTSRLTIMQDVKIPENSLVIKLNHFNQTRKNLWIQKWNEIQVSGKKFHLPDREDLNDLSKEPLLLFLLALYDFDDNALSKIAHQGLSKSSLYDKLFADFTKRQLLKNPSYRGSNGDKKKNMEEDFRLRIGFFALMLFLHDRVHHLEKDFDEELNVFSLSSEENKAKNILDGFFFVHKDQSIDGHNIENLSFEFLHKTFGEFLAADFMLRVARFKAEDDENISHLSNEKYFRQVFSFQWIHKQPKILDFLLEHSESIFNSTSNTQQIIKIIKKELQTLVDESINLISPVALHQFKTFEKLKHIAIYSQNLILLWSSVENTSFEFHLTKSIDNIQSWKVFVDLWKNYGEYEYVSYLTKYIDVFIDDNKLMIKKKISDDENSSYYTDYTGYTHIANNHYETILSYYESNFTLEDLTKLNSLQDYALSSSIANLTISKLEYLYSKDKNYFNNDLFWILWEDITFENKIKLINFYMTKNIHFDEIGAIKMLFSIPNNKKNLSSSEILNFTNLFMNIRDKENAYYAKDLLGNLFSVVGHERKGLTVSEELQFIELYIEVEGNRRSEYVRKMLNQLYKKVNKKINRLSLSEELKFIELYLAVGGNIENTKVLLNNLSNKLIQGVKGLSPSESLRFIELYIELIDHSIPSLEKNTMIIEILKEIIFRNSRLSPSQILKLIELSIAIMSETNFIEEMLEKLPKYLKTGNGMISKKIRKIEQELIRNNGIK